ncbi:hypothetical protein BBJ28_00018843 [Nothophytophthora sp. Chile5]|nr:hypothetical protein BBJ28_00018843 [Nothophytophthora sp. Chile5]
MEREQDAAMPPPVLPLATPASGEAARPGDVSAPADSAAVASPSASSLPQDGEVPAAERAVGLGLSDDSLHLRLKMLDERIFEVLAASSMSVADFRAKVALVTAIPAPRQRLIYRGKLMKDGVALAAYDVQDGHTVHLVAKPAPSATSTATPTATSTTSTSTTHDAAGHGRERLRSLLSSMDELDEGGGNLAELSDVTGARHGRRVIRRMPVQTRRRTPGQGDPTGDAWNLAVLREALSNGSTGGSGDSTAATTTTRRSQPLPMLRELLDEMNESPQEAAAGMGLSTHLDRTGRSAFPGGRPAGNTSPAVDLEPITQGILTVRTVLSTAALEPTGQEAEDGGSVPPLQQGQGETTVLDEQEQVEVQRASTPRGVHRGHRQFFVGQWLDVKDTVNQWLESTVMDIADGKVLVHYHGWPTRWDEWIEFDSDRIAAFRTRTLHTQDTQRMSPAPTTRVPSAPRVGDNDVRQMVIDVRNLMHEMMPHIDRLADLCEESQARTQAQHEEQQGEATITDRPPESAQPEAEEPETTTPTGQTPDDEVSEMAHLVAPLFDRFGRLLMDSVRYFDPLLRPELRGSSQRQQERRSTALRYGNGGSATRRQSSGATAPVEEQDTALSIRDLIASSPRTPSESTQPRRNIDVHIHAIVSTTSLSSLASLARANGGASDNGSNGVSFRRIRRPSTPPAGRTFDEAFGLPSLRPSQDGHDDGRAIANDDDFSNRRNDGEEDQSRVPLLGSYRHDSPSHADDSDQRRRTVEENLDDFLSDDFFGTSFGRHDDDDDDDESSDGSHGDSSHLHQTVSTPPSPYSQIPSPRTPQSQNSMDYQRSSIGVIPEVAEAEERLRRANEHNGQHNQDGGNGDNWRMSSDSSASAGSASSASSSGFPTFLEVMRRTLSGVRNFGFSSNSSEAASTPAEESNQQVELATGFSLPSLSSSSSSSPTARQLNENEYRPRSLSIDDSIIEEDLDEVD